MRLLVRKLAALLLLAPASPATTYVVDDDGGPGIDFTGIDQAVAVAGWGDVIVVRPGNYVGFTLGVPLSIVGSPGASVIGGIDVAGTPAGGRTCLAGLQTTWIRIQNCAGTVLLEELTAVSGDVAGIFATITVTNSSDVRLRGALVGGSGTQTKRQGLRVAFSRVEVTHSIVSGGSGISHNIYTYPGVPTDAGDGIFVSSEGIVHVSSSVVRGGRGGSNSGTTLCFNCPGGDGGAGIRMIGGTTVVVTGPAFAQVLGGDEGTAQSCNLDGVAGDGVTIGGNGSLRTSGATITAGSGNGCGPATQLDIRGPHVEAVPADPTLTIAGAISLQPVTFTVEAEPGSLVTLHLGRQLVVNDVPGVVEDELVVPLRNYNLGVLPASGTATHTFTIPAVSPPGAIFVAQARTVAPGGAVSLTHSMPLTVR